MREIPMTRRGYKIPGRQLDPLLQAFLMGAFLWVGWFSAKFILGGLIELIGGM
jgi:hypothetical protein